MVLMTRVCFPHVHDGELDSVEMVSHANHQETDLSQSVVLRDSGSALDSTTEGNEAEPFPSPPASRLIQEDAAEHPTGSELPSAAGPLLIEESSLPRSGLVQHSLAVELGAPNAVDDVRTPNIIIFGEAGVGKSSVINLIAGQKRAHISNDALGCTFQYQRHIITLNGARFAFWDTTGLDEGSEGTVPAKLAESNLRELIQGLAHSGGIHLVIYCIRGTRLTKALKHNYDLFYTAVCRRKVHVALVVTGLEHQQGTMETWWDENNAALRRCGMWFNAHACITTLDVDDTVVRIRRSESQKCLRDLVADYGSRHPWKVEASVISWATLRSILRGVTSLRKKVTRRVIICDRASPCRTQKRLLGDRQLEHELVYVNNPRMPPMSGKQAGALVFYTSPLLDPTLPEDMDALRTFYDTAGGELCPVIVVVRGYRDDQVAQHCWDAVASVPDIHAWPMADDQAKLDTMIEKRCIEHVEIKSSRLHRAYEVLMEFIAAVVHWQDSLGETLA